MVDRKMGQFPKKGKNEWIDECLEASGYARALRHRRVVLAKEENREANEEDLVMLGIKISLAQNITDTLRSILNVYETREKAPTLETREKFAALLEKLADLRAQLASNDYENLLLAQEWIAELLRAEMLEERNVSKELASTAFSASYFYLNHPNEAHFADAQAAYEKVQIAEKLAQIKNDHSKFLLTPEDVKQNFIKVVNLYLEQPSKERKLEIDALWLEIRNHEISGKKSPDICISDLALATLFEQGVPKAIKIKDNPAA